MYRPLAASFLALSLGVIAGCASTAPHLAGPALDALGSGSLVGQFRAFDGRTGREITLRQAAVIAQRADVVLFGEEHNDFVCNQIEAQLLAALAAHRPTSLAMEFFETDTQSALDAYLDGRLSEADFRTAARQRKAYIGSHRPLIELCREMKLPVIAANTPRELVRRFRQSALEYPDFRASLEPSERVLVPARFSLPLGGYFERFKGAMGDHGAAPPPASRPASQPETQPAESRPAVEPPADAVAEPGGAASHPAEHPVVTDESAASAPAATEPAIDESGDETMPQEPPSTDAQSQPVAETSGSQPASEPSSQPVSAPAHPKLSPEEMVLSMFKAQSLWDDSMAEAIANHRSRFADRRVMLVVGVFHVAHDGGTELKLRQRRPRDRVVTIAYRGVEDLTSGFEAEDRGSAEIVIYGLKAE